MIEILKQLLPEIITMIIAGGGVGAFLGIGQKKKNKKLIKATAEAIDETQNDRLDKIEKSVEDISIILKDSQFCKNLNRQTKKKIETIINIKEFDNQEILFTISNGQKSFISFIEDVLSENFELTIEELKTSMYFHLKAVKLKIDREKLNVERNGVFLQSLEDVIIKPMLGNFVIQFMDLKKLENGDRRKKLLKVSLYFIEQIISKTIDLHSNYAKSKTT